MNKKRKNLKPLDFLLSSFPFALSMQNDVGDFLLFALRSEPLLRTREQSLIMKMRNMVQQQRRMKDEPIAFLRHEANSICNQTANNSDELFKLFSHTSTKILDFNHKANNDSWKKCLSFFHQVIHSLIL